MRQNGYAEVDVNQLAFDKATCDFQGNIRIPVIDSEDYVICQEDPPHAAWYFLKVHDFWIDGDINPKATKEIYDRLEGYIEC